MNSVDAKRILETALICASQPVSVRDLRMLFNDMLGADSIKALLQELQQDWMQKGVELVCVASGWRFQSRPEMREYLDRLQTRINQIDGAIGTSFFNMKPPVEKTTSQQ